MPFSLNESWNLTNVSNPELFLTQGGEKTSCAEQAESYVLRIPFYYTIIFLSTIITCSVWYFIKLKNDKHIYVKQDSIESHLKQYFKICWKFRSMYGSIFTQLFDQVPDLSVINQLYRLSNDVVDVHFICHHMNVTHLFYASIFIFVFYRILSSLFVYRAVKNNSDWKNKILLSFLQFFDLTFILTLKINYKFQNTTPCSPQRYIANLEAVYEAYPQFVLQSYFLFTLNLAQNRSSTASTFASNYIVIVSIFFSLCSILSKKISQEGIGIATMAKYDIFPQNQQNQKFWIYCG